MFTRRMPSNSVLNKSNFIHVMKKAENAEKALFPEPPELQELPEPSEPPGIGHRLDNKTEEADWAPLRAGASWKSLEQCLQSVGQLPE